MIACIFLLLTLFFLSPTTFRNPYSTVLEDRNGHLLGANIAKDGQWRFPASDSIPRNFATCVTLFEDRHFYRHFGFDPIAFFRACYVNAKAGKIKQGGSTITMQTIRLARNNPPRTIWEKFYEILLAIRLEVSCSKKEILAKYASHAPFGGNVVGLDAAAWRYFGRKSTQLSWGEAALLAVLPNSPTLIYPGKNHGVLLKKRNRLLEKLLLEHQIDSNTYFLAKLEPIPPSPNPLPRFAPHLLNRCIKEGHEGKKIVSSLTLSVQQKAIEQLEKYHAKLESNSIHNGAVLILDISSAKVLAYVGNVHTTKELEGSEVDVIASSRSFGSLLKPLLYAAALDDGLLLPEMLMTDIPTNIAGYKPQNFFKQYDGAVPANEALCRSLNIPFVRLLHDYGTQKYFDLVVKSGISTLHKSPSHYGLSIILGGAESNLWDLTGMYVSLARSVVKNETSFASPILWKDSTYKKCKKQPEISLASLYFTLEAISENKRPGTEGQWLLFPSSQKIYWKTGTSFGSRDAWAVGVSSKYAVGVWLGNSSGEGRPGLTGIGTAAPLMFDLFSDLPKATPLSMPKEDFVSLPVCVQSGYKASRVCPHVQEKWLPSGATKSVNCPYHYLIHLDRSRKYRVNSSCEQVERMQHTPWFVLSTIQEWYYKPKHPNYVPLPSWRKDCEKSSVRKDLEIIYPKQKAQIYIPYEINNKLGKVVMEAAHSRRNATLFWHVDKDFVGETTYVHQLELQIQPGHHTLTIVDDEGQAQQVKFEVLAKTK